MRASGTQKEYRFSCLISAFLFPLVLVSGFVWPSEASWRQTLEILLLPSLAWYLYAADFEWRRLPLSLSIPFLWLLWLGLSGGWGSESARLRWHHSSLETLMVAVFFLMGVIYFLTVSLDMQRRAGQIFLAAGAGLLLVSLVLYFEVHGLSLDQRIVGFGLLTNPNRGGAVASTIGILALCYRSDRGLPIRAIAYAAFALAVVYVIASGSRNVPVTFVLAVTVYLAIERGWTSRQVIVGLAAIVAAIGLLMLLLPGGRDLVAEALNRPFHRLDIWADTLRSSSERPVLGYGFGDTERIASRFSHPHNFFLSNLYYGGIIAFVLGLATILIPLRNAAEIRVRQLRALAVSLMIFIIFWRLTNGGVPIEKPDDDWYHFWLPLALVWGLGIRPDVARQAADG